MPRRCRAAASAMPPIPAPAMMTRPGRIDPTNPDTPRGVGAPERGAASVTGPRVGQTPGSSLRQGDEGLAGFGQRDLTAGVGLHHHAADADALRHGISHRDLRASTTQATPPTP